MEASIPKGTIPTASDQTPPPTGNSEYPTGLSLNGEGSVGVAAQRDTEVRSQIGLVGRGR